MDHIRFCRLVRAIKREAANRGYYGDVFAEAENIPLVGTPEQQMTIATIGRDVSPGPMATRDRALLNRLVRATVLTSPPDTPPNPRQLNGRPTAGSNRRRAW